MVYHEYRESTTMDCKNTKRFVLIITLRLVGSVRLPYEPKGVKSTDSHLR